MDKKAIDYEFEEFRNLIDGYAPCMDDYLYIYGVQQKAYQLVECEGDYYFVNDGHKIAKNKKIYLSAKFVEGKYYADGTMVEVGYHYFDENGKMIVE